MYNLRNQLVAFGLLVALFGLAPVAGYGQDPAPPTAITYQGRLSEAGMPANGAYDLEFRLFTSEDVTTGSILTKILAQVLKDRPGLLECFEEEGQARKDEYLSNISIEAKDLNRDRQPEFFVEPSGGCDCGVRNCSLWVYRQTTTGYSLILETDGIGLAAERTQTNGYLDIAIEAQGTAFTRFRTLYKFDGRQYREHKTDSSTWRRARSSQPRGACNFREAARRPSSAAESLQGSATLTSSALARDRE
jgi:hypothetical protein